MRKWGLFIVAPEVARLEGYVFEDNSATLLFIVGTIGLRFLYLMMGSIDNLIQTFLIAAVPPISVAYLAVPAIFRIIARNTGTTLSGIEVVIWYLQVLTSGALLVIRYLMHGNITFWCSVIIFAFEAILFTRFLWKYFLLSLDKSVLASFILFLLHCIF